MLDNRQVDARMGGKGKEHPTNQGRDIRKLDTEAGKLIPMNDVSVSIPSIYSKRSSDVKSQPVPIRHPPKTVYSHLPL
jgi:hypothetical protein